MKLIVSENFESSREEIQDFLEEFNRRGDLFLDGNRNKIKIFELQGIRVNVKSFQVPNVINKIAYRFLRKSKAERSFFYAKELLRRGIGTPRPIAYAEEASAIRFTNSFYLSEHLSYDLTYRELVHQTDYPQRDKILKAFSRFTYKLHEEGVEFLDHSPGNTLIRRKNGEYQFFLVDLNRMNFKKLSFEERMKNFSRLTPRREMIETMASEYAKLINRPESVVFQKMWGYTKDFQRKLRRKRAVKKKLKFWKR